MGPKKIINNRGQMTFELRRTPSHGMSSGHLLMTSFSAADTSWKEELVSSGTALILLSFGLYAYTSCQYFRSDDK
jgi:hypothetical protein